MSFIKLDRKLLQWEWKDDPKMVALWIEILLQANYKQNNWHGYTFETGSFPTSLAKLSKATGLTISQVRTCLSKLKSTKEIAQESHGYGIKITVVKWADYQCQEENDDTILAQESHGHRTDIARASQHLKKEKKEKKERYIYDPSTNRQMSEEQEQELLSLMKGQS